MVADEGTQGRFRDQVPPSPPTITNHDDLLNTSRYECIGQHLRSRPPLAPSLNEPPPLLQTPGDSPSTMDLLDASFSCDELVFNPLVSVHHGEQPVAPYTAPEVSCSVSSEMLDDALRALRGCEAVADAR